MVKNRRINKVSDIKNLMQEQMNLLRNDETLDPIDRARALTYMSTVVLSSFRDGKAMDEIEEIKKRLEGINR